MVRVKICGITNVRDARLAARLGADALGFNFYERSARYVHPERAKAIIAALPPFVTTVGVFVDEEPERVMEIAAMCELDAVQLHGAEPPRVVHAIRGVRRIKALRVRVERDIELCRRYRVEAYLLDALVPGEFGGTGETFNWELARAASQFGPIILAGGLTPDNVAEAILTARPYAVDVASGVEAEPGKKDRELMEQFILAAKNAESAEQTDSEGNAEG
jgi:phosphoribosylanthranilate isomerase